MKNKNCIDCGKSINYRSIRCYSCAAKRKIILRLSDIHGSKNPNFIDGRTMKKYYCIDCSKEIHYDTWRYGKKRCRPCAMKERYKDLVHYSWESKKMDVNFKLRVYLRNRIREVLHGESKSKHTMELIGCSVEKLKKHIEKKFKRGMSWKNYGYYGWHVDHIIPCIRFDLSKPKEQEKCFNYKNLQPLWAEENLRKGRH